MNELIRNVHTRKYHFFKDGNKPENWFLAQRLAESLMAVKITGTRIFTGEFVYKRHAHTVHEVN